MGQQRVSVRHDYDKVNIEFFKLDAVRIHPKMPA